MLGGMRGVIYSICKTVLPLQAPRDLHSLPACSLYLGQAGGEAKRSQSPGLPFPWAVTALVPREGGSGVTQRRSGSGASAQPPVTAALAAPPPAGARSAPEGWNHLSRDCAGAHIPPVLSTQ